MSQSSLSIQTPPHDEDAEKALLGSILLNSNILENVADRLDFTHFYDKRHQIVYSTMMQLWSSAKPVDVLFVLDGLKTKEGLSDSEKASIDKEFLLGLISKSSLSSSAENTAGIIRDKYILRTLIISAGKIKSMARGEGESIDQIIDMAQKEIYGISLTNTDKNFVPINEVLRDAYERISNLHENDEIAQGIPTGFIDLDHILGGLHSSDLIILAARPSMGKTSLALEISRRVAMNKSAGTGVAIFSLEMGKDQLVDKFISSTAGIDLRKVKTGSFSKGEGSDEFMRLGEAIGKLDQAQIWIDDSGSLNITEFRTKARRLKSRFNVGLIVIDYLQLMHGNSGTNYGINRVQEVSDISRNLKMLAKELDVPIIALSQLSRGVESRDDKRPMLSDLRESGSIEQDADIVMFVHRDEMYNKDTKNKGKASLIIAKHRNGETGTVELAWIGRLATFGNLEGAKTSSYANK